MIRKTSKIRVRNPIKYSMNIEKVLTETWWLLGFIPLYSRETILSSAM